MDFCPSFPKLAQITLESWQPFLGWPPKNGLHVILYMLGIIFSNQSMLDTILSVLSGSLPRFCPYIHQTKRFGGALALLHPISLFFYLVWQHDMSEVQCSLTSLRYDGFYGICGVLKCECIYNLAWVTLDVEGCNLAKVQMNSLLAKLQVSWKEVKSRS